MYSFFESNQSAVAMAFVSKFVIESTTKVFSILHLEYIGKQKLLHAIKITFLIEIFCVSQRFSG